MGSSRTAAGVRRARRIFAAVILALAVGGALGEGPGQDAGTLYQAGIRHLRSGGTNLAVADFTAAIALSPENASLYYARGDAYLSGGERDLEKAIADFSEAARLQTSKGVGSRFRELMFDRGKKVIVTNGIKKAVTCWQKQL